MSTSILPFGNEWQSYIFKFPDVLGAAQNVASATATIDNYGVAYVAKVSAGNLAVVARQNLPGGSPLTSNVTVNITINATSLDGTVLTPLTVSVDLVAPPPAAPQAASIVLDSGSTPTSEPPVDPGNAGPVSFL